MPVLVGQVLELLWCEIESGHIDTTSVTIQMVRVIRPRYAFLHIGVKSFITEWSRNKKRWNDAWNDAMNNQLDHILIWTCLPQC